MSLIFQENNEADSVMTNDDVLGDSIPFDQQEALRQFCYQALKLGTGVGTPKASLHLDIWVHLHSHNLFLFWRVCKKSPLWYMF